MLADGKRGDVPVTAAAYGQALVSSTPSPFGPVAGLGADAFTANPLLGRDALAPLIETARAARGRHLRARPHLQPGRGRRPRPRARRRRTRSGSGWPRIVDELGETGRSGLADVGAVTGATEPQHLARLRELMPHTPFLLPGIGAQGGDVAALAPGLRSGRAGGLVTASRSIANAHLAAGGAPAEAARDEAERLREQAWGLGIEFSADGRRNPARFLAPIALVAFIFVAVFRGPGRP